jgi:hypothetical protein
MEYRIQLKEKQNAKKLEVKKYLVEVKALDD